MVLVLMVAIVVVMMVMAMVMVMVTQQIKSDIYDVYKMPCVLY